MEHDKRRHRDKSPNNFWSDAVIPLNPQFAPEQEYQRDKHVNKDTGYETPALAAVVSKVNLFPILDELLTYVSGHSETVSIYISHMDQSGQIYRETSRHGVDTRLLQSALCYEPYQKILTADGFHTFSVAAQEMEITIDDHKHLFLHYIRDAHLLPLELILRRAGVAPSRWIDAMWTVTHKHISTTASRKELKKFESELGLT